jgi:hydroxymethylpyrimidine pyrophosphatase-like HAD family hydrolase
MRYRLIGLDLDGTLLDPQGRVSVANRAAVAAAQAAGAMVVPCTGRGWNESKEVLEAIFGRVELNSSPRQPARSDADIAAPGVFVSGAAVSDVRTGRSLDLAVIEPHLAHAIVEHLRDLPEAVLVFRELSQAGHDYLVTGDGALTPNTQWWFQRSGATVHFQKTVTPADLHHTLRVAVVARQARMAPARQRLERSLGAKVFFHHFEAVQNPDPSEAMHILEIFAAGVDKWRGIEWVAQAHGISREEIAVIGDEVNDLTMLRQAGCGIAMGNAIDEAKAAARHVTRDNRNDGVAYAIEQLLTGQWS